MTSVAKRLLLSGKDLLPTVRDAQSPKNLYKLLNVYPNYGVGLKVDMTHGKAFGIKVWDGTVRRMALREFKKNFTSILLLTTAYILGKVLNEGNPRRTQVDVDVMAD
ncbi:17833_t:CDS:2 [Dentiscutata erythropus]|uniref:17833_t:CDS:1 n=1 Tax=Dentiscutata erythropus TaxID=1348616 RepID=A0A9N9BUR2_9GLOM|nr:17833_t:CDS:2 [Dentiscutata erythropus]